MVLTANNPSSRQQRPENPRRGCFFPETGSVLHSMSKVPFHSPPPQSSPCCRRSSRFLSCSLVSNASISAPSPLPLHLLQAASCAHPYIDWCRDAVLQHKICTSWHNMQRGTYTVTEGGWVLIGGLFRKPANGTQPSPPGHPPLWLELLMKLHTNTLSTHPCSNYGLRMINWCMLYFQRSCLL